MSKLFAGESDLVNARIVKTQRAFRIERARNGDRNRRGRPQALAERQQRIDADTPLAIIDAEFARFVGLGTANPWYGEAALAELDRAIHDLGLNGFKFHSLIQGFHLNDPLLVYPLVEKAIDLDVPVYFHCGTPIMAMPYKIQDLARLYPQARLIMGHRGWDYHFDVIHVEQNCPGLWIETSKCEYVNLEHSFKMGNVGRLLYGSNYPLSSMAPELAKVRHLVGLTSEGESAILGRNCQRLFEREEYAE